MEKAAPSADLVTITPLRPPGADSSRGPIGPVAPTPKRRRSSRLRRWRETVSNSDLAAWAAVAAFSLYVAIALAGGGGRALTLTFPQ
jgi:hypothetical protein